MDSKTLNMKSSTLKMFLLKGENLRLKDKLTEKENKITQLKIDQNSLHQYNHFSNIEMTGIPDSITNENLENVVIEL